MAFAAIIKNICSVVKENYMVMGYLDHIPGKSCPGGGLSLLSKELFRRTLYRKINRIGRTSAALNQFCNYYGSAKWEKIG
jgi:hypothetical protein